VRTFLRDNGPSVALFALLLFSLTGQVLTGHHEYNAEQLAHGGSVISFGAYLTTARFWFESFQNWQSEFLAVGQLVVLAIVLDRRARPSPSRWPRPTR
jgi:hypothetical protein